MGEYYATIVANEAQDGYVVCGDDWRILWYNSAFARLTGAGALSAVLLPDAMKGLLGEECGLSELETSLDSQSRLILTANGGTKQYDFRLRTRDASSSLGGQIIGHLRMRNVAAQVDDEVSREERKLLSQTSGWFYAAKTLKELLTIVSHSMKALIPEANGQLFIYGESRDVLDLACQWGTPFLVDHIEPDDCWALRRGRAFSYGTNEIEFACSHNQSPDNPSFCLPVVAHGDTIGLLHLSFGGIDLRSAEVEDVQRILEARWDLALICAEQISLAIANVKLRQELLDQSVRDQLTGLRNRRWFQDMARREINRALPRKELLSVIAFDIDHFKRFNDNHGHDAGDAVLRQAGEILRGFFGEDVEPCRVGGEEFAVLVPNTETEDAAVMAEALRRDVEQQTFRHAGQSLPKVTISCGVATVPDCGEDIDSLLKAADIALYKAKEAGRNTVIVHSPQEAATD